MKDKCNYCGTSYEDIVESGFVGCDKCYQEIEPLRHAIEKMYRGKTHTGRKGRYYGKL